MALPAAFSAVPDWFSWENQGAGVAVADVTGSGRPDLVVLMVDNGPGQNRGVYRIGRDLDTGGVVTGGWMPWACGNPPPYGNRAPWEPPQPNEELRLEVYRPPYLFRGARPEITGAPGQWGYGQTVTVDSPQAGGLIWAQLISPGSTTHAFDCHQRLVDLPITAQAGGRLQVTAPAGPGLAPPGWYMLTVVDQNRVPSTARWIHLT